MKKGKTQNAEALAALADSLDEGVFFVDASLRLVSANAALARALGYEPREMAGMPVSGLVAAPRAGAGFFKNGRTGPEPVRLISRRGDPVPSLMRVLRFGGGEAPEVVGAGIVSWPEAAAKLPVGEFELPGSSSAFLEKVFAGTYDGIFVVDTSSRYILVNEAYCHMLGYAREELIGAPASVFPHYSGDEPQEEILRPVEATGGCSRYETTWKRRKGDVFPVEICFTALETEPGGEIAGMIGIVRDMTAHKRMEQELRRARDELEKTVAERTKSLEESNTALRVLLGRRDEDRKTLEKNILHNINELVLPYLEKLKAGRTDERQRIYLEILEKNFNDLAAPLMKTDKYLCFTPSELQVTNLIKQGKSTKEISDVMNICEKTVSFHRDSIRRKMGLSGRKVSLRDHLLSGR